MGNYVLLYIGGSEPQGQEEAASVMQAWTSWFTNLGDKVVDPGNPFSAQVKSVSGDRQVSDGPIGARATGYSIVKADSLDTATDIAKNCPHLQAGGEITVYEVYAIS